jgi:molecular chaperone IbpA
MVTSKALGLFDNFNQLTPYAVGYDRIFDQLQQYAKNNLQSSGFPPYNIQKGGDTTYTIEIALAGFGKEDITVELTENTLSVRSDKKDESDEYTFHRGISYRKFDRKFTLADDIVVNSASLENGMLTIELERIVPEEKKPRIIEVK